MNTNMTGVFKNLCVCVLLTKVAFALEGLNDVERKWLGVFMGRSLYIKTL